MAERCRFDSHVRDDPPNGFRDLTDSYTKYAESYKTANPGAHLRQRMSPVRWFQVCMALAQRPTLRPAVFGGAVGAGKQVPLLVYRPRPWQTLARDILSSYSRRSRHGTRGTARFMLRSRSALEKCSVSAESVGVSVMRMHLKAGQLLLAATLRMGTRTLVSG
jgi:hypothetical protein